MFDQWRQPLDIPALIRKSITLKGDTRISELVHAEGRTSGRLDGIVLNDAPLHYELNFGLDAAGHRAVHGRVEAVVELTCQRCLQPVAVEIHADVMLAVLKNELDAKKLPESMEFMVLGDEPVWLADLIEDEILLALPVVPRHAHLCAPAHREHDTVDAVQNPFAALADLVKPSTH